MAGATPGMPLSRIPRPPHRSGRPLWRGGRIGLRDLLAQNSFAGGQKHRQPPPIGLDGVIGDGCDLPLLEGFQQVCRSHRQLQEGEDRLARAEMGVLVVGGPGDFDDCFGPAVGLAGCIDDLTTHPAIGLVLKASTAASFPLHKDRVASLHQCVHRGWCQPHPILPGA